MRNLDSNLEDLVNDIRSVQKEKIKWTCPICSGSNLSKGKVIETESYDTTVNVSTTLGELDVSVSKNNVVLEHVMFPIRYCPWCGRKVKNPYKKTKKV